MSDNHFIHYAGRPGILTAVGVTSIVIASFSLLVDFGSFVFATGISRFATSQAIVAMPVAVPPVATRSEYVGPQGLSSAQRQAVIAGLSQGRRLSDARQKQLDDLLADVGQDVIRLSPDNLTADRVATYVTDVQQIPGSTGESPDDLFILGSGRLQLSDHSAVFFPDNSPSPIRSGGGSYSDSSGSHLASEQIAAVVERSQALCNHAMNDAQLRAFEAALEAPQQMLITPSPSVTQTAGQVLSVQSLGDGTVAVTTKTSSMSFGQTGQNFPGVMPLGAMGAPWNGPRVTVNPRDATLMLLDSLLCFLAAGLLLASGIVALRNSPACRWMHLAYAAGKTVIVALSCYVLYSVAVQLDAKSGDAQSTALAWMLIVGAPGIFYPAILVFAMNAKSVREFLDAPTVARIF